MLTSSVVVYNTPRKELLSVVKCALDGGVDTIYVIDNSPNDALRTIETQSPKIRYIHNANIGYGGAHNIAIREAIAEGARYHAVLNPDIEFAPDVLTQLERFADSRPTAGWIMPRVTYPDGTQQYLCKLLPSPADLIIRRFLPKSWGEKRMRKFEMRESGYTTVMNVPFLSGCFMFLRVSALRKVGLFDERFFMYGEDIDLSRRMHASFETIYYPCVSIVHRHEAASYKNRRMMIVHIRNIMRYFSKWGWLFDTERRIVNRRAQRMYCGQSDTPPTSPNDTPENGR